MIDWDSAASSSVQVEDKIRTRLYAFIFFSNWQEYAKEYHHTCSEMTLKDK